MNLLIASILMAALVWGFIALVHGSLPLSMALFLVATSCFPAEFLSFDLAGLTWTVDRLWYFVIVAHMMVLWYRGELSRFRCDAIDLILAVFVLWLVARTITQPLGVAIAGQPHTLMHLINGYLVPISLYFMLRITKLKPEQLRPAAIVMMALGLYLSGTAFFELTKQWAFVFPKLIADPTLGIHFGRARGPMLQSVRLGVCLLACLACAVVAVPWLNPTSKPRWLFSSVVIPIYVFAIYGTYTRSIWMGLGLVIVVLVAGCLSGLCRRAAIVGIVAACVLVLAIKGPDLVAFKREYSEAETRESTYMRGAFAYVSWKMFHDRPIAGFGFNQFQVYNLPYLANRSTEMRLESIRGYVHHNSYLSLLVDLGLVGFSLYMILLAALVRRTWALWRSNLAEKWARGTALFALAVAGVHLIQMAFHEVSFSSIENTILFVAFGLVAAAHRQVRQLVEAACTSARVNLQSSAQALNFAQTSHGE